MAFLTIEEKNEILENITSNVQILGKKYKSRKKTLLFDRVDYNEVDEKIKDGWIRTGRDFKTVAEISKEKKFHKIFEDRIWCLMYDLGFRKLNLNSNLKLKYGKNVEDYQQIDILAVNDEVALIIECKSSEKYTNANYKNYIESLPLKIDGYRKCIGEIIGKRRVKYIFATEKQVIGDADKARLESINAFHMDENAVNYIEDIVKNYKGASIYQFFGILFKGETINLDSIEVPALSGMMGGKKYFMFSIEPGFLLKIGFILHRTRTNEREDPTYQRLLVPSRLRGIQKFLEEKNGFFPNSIIVNFNTKLNKGKLDFQQGSSKGLDSSSRYGILKIPNSYSIAYIIDGQHRLYGYSNTSQMFSSTIPVVAFENLTSDEQLNMFMDINENQKKIKPRLKLTLQEDINWNSENPLSRMKALRSGIINRLSDLIGPFKDTLSIGEDEKEFSPNFIDNALRKSPGILPKNKGNKIINEVGSLYDIQVQIPQKEMERVRIYVSDLLNKTYLYISEEYSDLFENKAYFIRSNRGVFATIYILGSLNRYLTEKKRVDINTSVEERISFMKPYLDKLLIKLSNLSKTNDDPYDILGIQGQRAEKTWSMIFESIIHDEFPDFYSIELKRFEETQDEEIQNEARERIDKIEKWIKETVLGHLYELFGEDYYLDIPSIYKDANDRATDEMAAKRKEGKKIKVTWDEMLFITDYESICTRFWNRDNENENFKRLFQKISINLEEKLQNSKNEYYYEIGVFSNKKGSNWIKSINSLRNTVSHSGTKTYGVDKEELQFIRTISRSIFNQD